MTQRTVLQLINQVQQELGLPQSATVIGNTDPTTVQLLSFLQLANEDLRDYSDEGWKALQFEFNLVVNPPIKLTGDTSLNSPTIINITPNTAGLSGFYWAVSGDNLPQGARIKSVDSSSQITLNMEAVAAEVGASLVFAQDTYQMPIDFRKYTNRTWWDRTNRWELLGPDSAQLDQWHRSGIIATGPRRHFRNIGPFTNTFRLWPPPAEVIEPLQLVFEYISFNTIMVAGSMTNFAQYFANDTDVPILDDRALMLSMKWRFWEQKGMNYISKRDEYDQWVNRLMARDGGAKTLSLVQRIDPLFISSFNVQDGFFPGPTGPNVS